MENRLEERVALVTGGAKRLGRSLCVALAASGCHVIVHYRTSRDEAMALCEELGRKGVRADAVRGDLAEAGDAAQVFSQAARVAGPVDILINNASIFPEDHVLEFGEDRLFDCIRVNAYAPLVLSRAFAAQKRPGVIVNLLDTRVQDYDHRHASYHLSKRMLMTLTSMLALELAPSIRVNAVAPGLILPPEGQSEAYLKELAGTNPLGSYGGPEDIVEAVLFLIRSDFVTGQIIYVDGGRHLKGRVYE